MSNAHVPAVRAVPCRPLILPVSITVRGVRVPMGSMKETKSATEGKRRLLAEVWFFLGNSSLNLSLPEPGVCVGRRGAPASSPMERKIRTRTWGKPGSGGESSSPEC